MVERVALLSLHSSPLAPLGGPDAGGMNLYVRRLAEDLMTIGVRADIFTRRTDPYTPEIVHMEGGARLIHLEAGPPGPLPKSVLPLHIPALTTAFQEFMQQQHGLHYDLLHSHYWISGLTALRVRETLGTPVIHMFHTLSKVKEFHAGGPDPTDSALRFDGERRIVEAADAVVGATALERNYMERLYGRSPALFEVIPPGVDLHMFRPRDKLVSRRALRLDADRVVLFVGRFDRIKGLDLLLRALADLTPTIGHRIKLVVVGGDQDERRDPSSRYRQQVERLGLSGLVEFRGVVPQSSLPLYYTAADLCAVPSVYESFGMVAIEAMACGTPVVAFRVGGLATTIQDGQTGFLAAPGGVAEFASRLREALLSSNLESVGRKARFAVHKYRWDAIARKTLELYDTVERLSTCPYRRAANQR